jgi:hypothetical protein
MNGTPITPELEAEVREIYPHVSTKKIAIELGRTVNCIYKIASRLGLHKTPEYLASPDACRLRRDASAKSIANRFVKGSVPHNKGVRRPGWAPGRMSETQFKPGVRTGIAARNWCPIGTIRKDGEGFLRIKVREGKKGEAYGFGNTKIWPLLNRHVWEQHKGPIPPNHAVVFRDGDRSNCDIDNLECIHRRDLMRRNTVHNLPKPLVEVIQLRGALNRRIRSLNEKQDSRSSQPSL